MNYALIGCGRISVNHLKAAAKNNFDIVAVCDIVPEHMETALLSQQLQKERVIKRYYDYKHMLAEVTPDLVAIATESGKHAAIALDCINAGCHVIIEKPMALSIKEADEIIETAYIKGVKVSVCHQNRFNLSIQHIRRSLDQGRFGKLSHGCIHVRWYRGEDYYRQAPWRGTKEQDGGVLMNQSIHGIDLLRWMMGDNIEEVFAYTAKQFHPYMECEDVGLAVVRFSNGALGTIEGTSNIYPQNLEETLYIFGESGTVKAGGKSTNTIEIWRFADERLEDKDLNAGMHEKIQNVYGNGHIPLYADMAEAIYTGREPYITAEAGKRALELVLAIYHSAQTGQPVQFPIKNDYRIDFEV